MTKKSLGIFFILIFSYQVYADIFISFGPRFYSIREIIQKVERDTPIKINLPFADIANQKKSLPAEIELNNLLYWVCHYYESHNDAKITFTKTGNQIHFKKLHFINQKSVEKELTKGLILNGRQWTLHEVLFQAQKQIGKKIVLPFEDPKKLKADYQFKCSLEELLEEVRNYYKDHLGKLITYQFHNNRIEFITNGTPIRKTLKVELISNLRNKTKPLAKKIPHQILPKIKKGKVTPKKVFKKPTEPKATQSGISQTIKHLSINVFNSNFEAIKKINITRFVNDENLHFFMKELILPNNENGSFLQLKNTILPYLNNRKGQEELLQHLSILEQNQLLTYDRNQKIMELRELWLKQSLNNFQRNKAYEQKELITKFHYRGDIGTGKNIAQSGSSTKILDPNKVSFYTHHHLGIQSNYSPKNDWQLDFGMGFDYTRSTHSDDALTDLGGISLNISSSHLSTGSSLRAISPFLNYHIESDLLASDGIYDHHLLLLGTNFHWMEAKNTYGFDKVYADSQVIISINNTKAHESIDLVTLMPRKSQSVGFKHRFSLIDSHTKGIKGWRPKLHIMSRSSDAEVEKGVEFGIGTDYIYSFNDMHNTTELNLTQWSREQSVQTVEFSNTFYKTITKDKSDFIAEFEYIHASSDDSIYNFNHLSLTVGIEVKW